MLVTGLKSDIRSLIVCLLWLHSHFRVAHSFCYYYCCYLLAWWLVHCELLNHSYIQLLELPPHITADLRSDQPHPD